MKPSTEQMRAAWGRAAEQRAYWDDHHAELLQRYPDQFVAVRGGEVIAVSPNLDGIVNQLAEQGLQPTQVWLEFIAAHSPTLIL